MKAPNKSLHRTATVPYSVTLLLGASSVAKGSKREETRCGVFGLAARPVVPARLQWLCRDNLETDVGLHFKVIGLPKMIVGGAGF